MGNSGVIRSGDVQWMTAGSGIVHEEMPEQHNGALWGLQLWANLPASDKMMEPRYRGLTASEIPTAAPAEGVEIKILAGTVGESSGPVQDIITEPQYLDVTLAPRTAYEHLIPTEHNAFAYVVEGEGHLDSSYGAVGVESLARFDRGDTVIAKTEEQALRFLLISGKPIGEPIAWYGPIVMNTDEELRLAFQEYQDGTFIKSQQAS